MIWTKKILWLSQYKYSNSNQHGDTFRKAKDKKLSVATLVAEVSNARDLKNLILLSDRLDTPVRYNFDDDPQTAHIEIVSKEQLERK